MFDQFEIQLFEETKQMVFYYLGKLFLVSDFLGLKFSIVSRSAIYFFFFFVTTESIDNHWSIKDQWFGEEIKSN